MTLAKHKQYLAAWLDISAEQFEKANGITLTVAPKRCVVPEGLLLKYPLYAFQTQNVVDVSCVPEIEVELRNLLETADYSNAIQKMQDYFDHNKEKFAVFTPSRLKVFGLDEFNLQADITRAFMLESKHYEQYRDFYLKIRPYSKELEPDKWLPQHFQEILSKQVDFFLFEKNTIVSGTDVSVVPYMADEVIELGVDTLRDHRRNGYAFSVCSAFIQYHLQRGLVPIWRCTFDNDVSDKLAYKLGFQYLGNEYSLCTLPGTNSFTI